MPNDPTQPGQEERAQPTEVPAPWGSVGPLLWFCSQGCAGSGCRFDRIAHTRDTMHKDGINSLSYSVLRVEKLQLFTKITVDVGKP